MFSFLHLTVAGTTHQTLRVQVKDLYEIAEKLNPSKPSPQASSRALNGSRSSMNNKESAAGKRPNSPDLTVIDVAINTFMRLFHCRRASSVYAEHATNINAVVTQLHGARQKLLTSTDRIGMSTIQGEMKRIWEMLPKIFSATYPYIDLAYALDEGNVDRARQLHQRHQLAVLHTSKAILFGESLKVSVLGKACITPDQTAVIPFLVHEMGIDPNERGILDCSIIQGQGHGGYRETPVACMTPLCMALSSTLTTAEKVQNASTLISVGADLFHGMLNAAEDDDVDDDGWGGRNLDYPPLWFAQAQSDPSKMPGFREVFVGQRVVAVNCDLSALQYAFSMTCNLVERATQTFFSDTMQAIQHTILDEVLISSLTENRACIGSLNQVELQSLCNVVTVMVSNGIGWSERSFQLHRAKSKHDEGNYLAVEQALTDAHELREIVVNNPTGRHILVFDLLKDIAAVAGGIICGYSPDYTTAELCFIEHFPHLPLYRPVQLKGSSQIIPMQIN